MKKFRTVFCVLVLLIGSVALSKGIYAQTSAPFKPSNSRPASAVLSNVDEDGNALDNKDIKIIYDKKGRIFDDGAFYHIYDKNGHEILVSSATDGYARFGIYHLDLRDNSYTVQYNADGSVKSFNSGSGKDNYMTRYDLKFFYDENGNIKEVYHYEDAYEQVATYTYDGNHIASVVVKQSEGAYPSYTTEFTFDYSGDKIIAVLGRMYTVYGNEMQTFTDISYSGDRLMSVTHRFGEGFQKVEDYINYTYDDKGRVAELNGMTYFKSEEYYRVAYNYGGKKEKARQHNYIVSVKPYSGMKVERMFNQIQINFSQTLDGVDSGAQFYIVDKDTFETVYTIDNFSYSKKTLNLYLPSYKVDKIFEKGHTYSLVADGGFVYPHADGAIGPYYGDEEWSVTIDDGMGEYLELTGSFSFSSSSDFDSDKYRIGSARFTYNHDYFRKSASQYSSPLAELSLDMAMASYNYEDASRGDKHIKEFLQKLQFENIVSNNDYLNVPGENTTGVCIGSKKIDDFTLIAVGIRSGGYESEWYGNFQVGNQTDHAGFSRGRQEVISCLESYIKNNGIKGKVKFWIAGYSRGSAIANLSAAKLDDKDINVQGISYTPVDDVYAYCFEVPASTTSKNASSSKYRNIFCIVNPEDIVVRMPLMKWGFTRYGRVLILPYDHNSADYKEYIQTVSDNFANIYGQRKETLPAADHYKGVNALMDYLYRSVQSVDKYNMMYESALGTLAKMTLGKGTINSDAEVPMAICGLVALGSNLNLAQGNPISRFEKIVDAGGFHNIDLENLMFAHYAEYTLAWIQALNGTGVLESRMESASTSLTSNYGKLFVKVMCPVNVTLFRDSNRNEQIASVLDDGTIESSYEELSCYIDEAGAKVFELPADEEFFFTIAANDDDKMNIAIYAQDDLTGEILSYQSYEDLPLEISRKYTMDIDTSDLVYDGYWSELCFAKNSLDETYYDPSSDSPKYYSLTVNAEGEGTVLYPDQVIPGDKVTVEAIANEGYHLDGFFDEEGNRLSEEESYSFVVSDDSVITAKFLEGAPKGEGSGSKSPTGFIIAAVLVLLLAAGFVVMRKKKSA